MNTQQSQQEFTTPGQPVDRLEHLPAFGQEVVDSNRPRREEWLGRAAAWGVDTPLASALAHDTAHRVDEDTRLKLVGIRDNLGTLGEGQRALIEPYLSRFYDPDSITGHSTVSEWLGDSQHGASDETLLDFLGQHTDEVAKLAQSERVVEAIHGLKKQRYDLEKLGSTEGWLSSYAGSTAEEIYDADVAIFDAWGVAVDERYGYCVLGTKKIMVGQPGRGEEGEQDLIDRLSSHTLDHELNHYRFDNNKKLPRFEMEAFAQHVALAMKDGGERASVIDPELRIADGPKHSAQASEQEYVYYHERSLLALELSAGYITINPKVAMRAYTSSGEDSADFSEYEQCLDSSWGVDGFRAKLAGLIDRNEQWIKAEYPNISQRDAQDSSLGYAKEQLELIALCQKMKPQKASWFAETVLAQSAKTWSDAKAT